MNESVAPISIDQIRRRIRAEYLEMPGLRLTHAQAQRLWGLDERTCLQLLESLIKARFLERKADGMYARVTDGAVTAPPLRMAGAEIGPRRAAPHH